MSKTLTPHQSVIRVKRTTILQLILIGAAMAILIPSVDEFSSSWTYIKSAQPFWVLVALIGLAGTAFFASLVYVILLPRKLPVGRTTLVQVATFFTNRLLPSGLGGIGFNAMYLVKQLRLSKTDAAIYATANNAIGFIAFALAGLIAMLIGDTAFTYPDIQIRYVVAGILAVLLLTFLAIQFSKLQHKITDLLGHIGAVAITISERPKRLIGSILSSSGITFSFMVILWASSLAVGANIGITDLFIAFMAGATALAVSPTPGGLGPVEAAMVAVLVAAGNNPAISLATVLLFRFFSYWLPVIPGIFAFRLCVSKKYV